MRISTGWKISAATVFLMVLCLGLGTLVAHHSFAMFDTGNGKAVTLSGTVTLFEWTNPHAYIEIDVPKQAAPSNTGLLSWEVPASCSRAAGRSNL